MVGLLRNSVVYAVLYIVLMLPTYVLPYFGSNSALFGAASLALGMGFTLQWWMHFWCLAVLVIMCWLRGEINEKSYLPVFPFLAAVFDMVPGINLIPLIATLMHLLAIILGVMGGSGPKPAANDVDVAAFASSLRRKSRIALVVLAILTSIAIAGSAYSVIGINRGGLSAPPKQ